MTPAPALDLTTSLRGDLLQFGAPIRSCQASLNGIMVLSAEFQSNACLGQQKPCSGGCNASLSGQIMRPGKQCWQWSVHEKRQAKGASTLKLRTWGLFHQFSGGLKKGGGGLLMSGVCNRTAICGCPLPSPPSCRSHEHKSGLNHFSGKAIGRCRWRLHSPPPPPPPPLFLNFSFVQKPCHWGEGVDRRAP